MIISTISGPR